MNEFVFHANIILQIKSISEFKYIQFEIFFIEMKLLLKTFIRDLTFFLHFFFSIHSIGGYPLFSYKMVSQIMLRTYEEKVFTEKKPSFYCC